MLGWGSGVGRVIANMIGAGVLTSTGCSAMNLGPGQILLAWIVGGIGALAGARAYAAVAQAIPRSGGEYRYLSTLWHPMLGYIAGFTSLLVGFSQPVAADAQLVGYYTTTLGFDVDFRNPPAMVIGCALGAVIYLLGNWVFVANLTPKHFGEWISGDNQRITIAHDEVR